MSMLSQILVLLFAPAVFLLLQVRGLTPKWLGPVVLSYLLGILLASTGWITLDDSLSKTVSEASIMIAIPMLLFTTDVPGWLKTAKPTMLSFLCCVASAGIVTVSCSLLFAGQIDDIWQAAGMIAGVNTGGTPNMQAVGLATGASDQLFIQLNAADILFGGLYLVFLTSVAPSIMAKFYPPYQGSEVEDSIGNDLGKWSIAQLIAAFVLALVVVGLTMLLVSQLFDGDPPVAIIILLVTTGSVCLSFVPRIRQMRSSFDGGNYLLLIFCVAIGMRSQADEIVNNSAVILQYYGMTYVLTILLHYFLAWLLKIDRDTVLITSVASIYGPVFVGQIAHVLGNKRIIFGGVATGLVGYAVGNYLGLAVSYLLR